MSGTGNRDGLVRTQGKHELPTNPAVPLFRVQIGANLLAGLRCWVRPVQALHSRTGLAQVPQAPSRGLWLRPNRKTR